MSPAASQSCAVPGYSYWTVFAKSKSVFSGEPDGAPSAFYYSQLKSACLIFCFYFFCSLLAESPFALSKTLNFGRFEATAVIAVSVMFLIFCLSLKKSHAPANVLGSELVNFVIFCKLGAVFLLVSANLLTAFFALEVLGATTLYVFFVFGGYGVSGARQQSVTAVSSCVYQFIINFFGSLLFYTALGFTIYYHASSALFGASSRLAEGRAELAQSIVAASLFLKLGTGP